MVDERRDIPADGKHHVAECAHDAGFGDTTLLGRSVSDVLEVVDYEVGPINDLIEADVHTGHQLGIGVETEFVDLAIEVVVTEELTGSIDIVSREIEKGDVGGDDSLSVRTGDVGPEGSVHGNQGAFCTFVRTVVEIFESSDTLLGDVKLALTRGREQGGSSQ